MGGARRARARARPRRTPRARVLAADDPLAALRRSRRAWRARAAARASSRSPARPARPRRRTSSPRCSRRRARDGRQPRATSTPRSALPLDDPRGAAPAREALVLELAMRGAGQIAELTAISEPDVGVIVNVGPAHLELLGSLEAIAAAKAELIAGLRAGATRRDPGRRAAARAAPARRPAHVRFGAGGDVPLLGAAAPTGASRSPRSGERDRAASPASAQAHQLAQPARRGRRRRALGVAIRRARSRSRSRRCAASALALPGGVTVDQRLLQRQPDVDARRPRRPRRDAPAARASPCSATCSSSAPTTRRFHRELGAHAAARGVDAARHRRAARGGSRRAFAGEPRALADAPPRRRAARALLRAGRHGAREGLARRRARARRRGAARGDGPLPRRRGAG